MNKHRLGLRIASLRQERKLSQELLAERSQYSTEFISLIERGIHWPSLPGLVRIASALDTDLKSIFDFKNETVTAPRELAKGTRPVGRPRIHPKPNPDLPKRPRGRPRSVKK
ncbi:MAG: XRE family transcriptional regulator [Puniceicoccaceae bacterium]|nr:MAG: XRE family transcriptional regulator [Puniceicoccaceae bacterium]